MSARTPTLACICLVLVAIACRGPGHADDWSYTGATGPEHWAELSPEYALARTGRHQSPIDIAVARSVATNGDALEVEYHETAIDIMNNGHTIEDDYHGGGHIVVGGHDYLLAQFHLHSPSEHTIDGERFPMELHLVHRDARQELAVVAVMIAEGQANAVLERLESHAPAQPGRANRVEGVLIDAAELLPASLASFRYSGSLTTPPCTEDVSWFVLRQPIEASREQIDLFRTLYFGNNRPTQPLHGRVVALVE